MMTVEDPENRVGKAIDSEIIDQGFTYKEFAEKAETSIETLAKVRRGETVSRATMRRIEIQLGWAPGSSEQIAHGAPPTPTPQGTLKIPHVPRTGSPVEAREIADHKDETDEAMERGEYLWVWSRVDGQTHYRFERTESDRFVAISIPFPADMPLEEAVRRLRAKAIGAMV